jgi:tetratricopeptide (TPR) repeat protein
MDFLTPGEKVKWFRKKLKMSQEDLASNALTRPYISMIETGKRDLSRNIARILTAKFNEKAKELNIDLHADFDFIISTPYEDALKYCSEKLDKAVEKSDLKEVLEISIKFDLKSTRARTYYKLGNLYFDNHNYINAFDNYDMSLGTYRDSGEHNMESFLYNCLGKCKINLLQYDDALIYYKRANYYSALYGNTEILKLSTYNMALCYKKLDDIDTAIEYIDKCLTICNKHNDFKEYVYANILKANCYEIEDNINDALSIYNALTTEFLDIQDPLLGIIYNNLGLLHVKMNNYVRSIEYFNKAEKIRMKKDMPTLSHTIIEKSTVYINQGFYNEAITLIELGLDMAAKNNDIEYLIRGKYLLIDIYNANNENSKTEETYLSILKLLKDTKGNYNDILKVYNSLTILYLKQNNLNKVKDYLLMSQSFIEKCDN